MKRINKLLISFILIFLISSSNLSLANTKVINSISKQQLTSSQQTLKNIVVFIEFSDGENAVTHHLDDDQSIENAYKIFNSDELWSTIYFN